MSLWYFFTAIMYDFIHWIFCGFFCWLTLPTLSPVNGFFVVGVVIVFSIFTFCTTSSVPGSNFGSNSRFYQMESLLFYDWIAINWTVFCYVIHWRCYNFSCIWIFDTWFTWNFFFATFGAFGSNSSLCPEALLQVQSVQSRQLHFCNFCCWFTTFNYISCIRVNFNWCSCC